MGMIEAFREMRERAPETPVHRLGARIALWKAYRLAGVDPVVRLHARSRMRISAGRAEHGIRAGIFLFRDAYEPSVRHAIDHFVQPGATCMDVGANLGLWTLRMAERAGPTGRVLAFEPAPATAAALRDAVALSGHDNVAVFETALGDREGTAIIHIPDDVGRSALAPESAGDEAVEVRIARLDDIWDGQGRPAVGFVKIDVEGAEPLALEGARAMLSASRPAISCEINPAKLANMGAGPRDVFGPLAALGYRALRWDGTRCVLAPHEPDPEDGEVLDLIFVAG